MMGDMAKKSPQQQIADAWEERQAAGMTVPELLEATGLDLDVSSLSRKLRGKQPIDADRELGAIASGLGIEIRVGRGRKAS